MKNLLKASLIAAAIASVSPATYAAGLGQLSVQSALGQPLKAEIQLTATGNELQSLTAKIASPDMFRQANVPYSPVVPNLRVRIDRSGRGAVLKLTSARPVNEPFVSVLLELNWANGQLLREYSLLLDPVEFSPAPSSSIQVVSPPATVSPRLRELPPSQPITAPSSEPMPLPPAARMPTGRVRELPPDAPSIASAQPVAATPMPAPAPVSPAPATEDFDLGGSDYVVSKGDTLRKIAEATKPAGVTLDQMLVALYRENRKAFIGDNMNRLRAGVVVRIPTADKVQTIGSTQARREVVAQARDFQAYRRSLAGAAPVSGQTRQTTGQTSSGTITARVDEPQPAASQGDKLVVSRADTTSGGNAAGSASARETALQEDLRARERGLEEANARLEILEENIRNLQDLSARKDQQIAELRQQLDEERARQADQAAATPDAPPPTVAPPQQQPPATTPATVQRPAPVPPQAQPGLFSNPLVWAGIGGIVLLILAYVAYTIIRRRKAEAEEAEELLSDFPSESSAGGQSVDTGTTSVLHTDFSQASLAAINADEGVDPIAEADVYIGYGRDAQAEEILRDELRSDPDRLALYTKLLEIYSRRKNLKQFENIANELYARTGGNGEEWEAAAEMGRALDMNNELYQRSGSPETASEDDTPVESTGPSLSNLDFTASAPSAPFGESSSPMKDTWAMPGRMQAGENEEELDFDLDINQTSEPSAPVTQPDKDMTATDLSSNLMDFDLDLDFDEGPATETDEPAPMEDDNVDFEASSFEPPQMDGSEDDGASETETKLELARAYKDMGDNEGAKELLEEVMRDGSPEQKTRAQTLLGSMN